ncbi:hypothetical protein AVEN_112499-1 [Araneus ventricosus]|uniref:Uncharacterized protein n=1 Tax=Araneus ventricosus TaxID=182803 RepID=A0A4Y2LYF2_ARAVE|nr:hypothetical protein AVEN_112499-1 [Araneus ventricosus]
MYFGEFGPLPREWARALLSYRYFRVDENEVQATKKQTCWLRRQSKRKDFPETPLVTKAFYQNILTSGRCWPPGQMAWDENTGGSFTT